jgi:hypothetical protein
MDNGRYRGNSFVSHERVFKAGPITFQSFFIALPCAVRLHGPLELRQKLAEYEQGSVITIVLNDMNMIALSLFDEN